MSSSTPLLILFAIVVGFLCGPTAAARESWYGRRGGQLERRYFARDPFYAYTADRRDLDEHWLYARNGAVPTSPGDRRDPQIAKHKGTEACVNRANQLRAEGDDVMDKATHKRVLGLCNKTKWGATTPDAFSELENNQSEISQIFYEADRKAQQKRGKAASPRPVVQPKRRPARAAGGGDGFGLPPPRYR